MNRKLIFLDIDGTLTPPGSNEPPASALAAIRSAQKAGHKVFLCTGRNPAMLSPLLQYGFDGYIGCAGGYVAAGEEVLYDCPMTEEQRVTALELLKESGVFRTIEAKDGSYCDENLKEFLRNSKANNSEFLRWRKAIEERLSIRPIREYDGRPIYKIVFMCEREEQLDPVRAVLGDQFNFVLQDAFDRGCLNGEMINRKFDKGTAVKLVTGRLGYDISDTIGFGDSMNDKEMIEVVGKSVCMANGSPTLQGISDMVCPAVEDDGLAKAFEQLGLLEGASSNI